MAVAGLCAEPSLPCRGVFLSLIQKHFPSTRRRRDRGGGKRKRKCPPSSSSAFSHSPPSLQPGGCTHSSVLHQPTGMHSRHRTLAGCSEKQNPGRLQPQAAWPVHPAPIAQGPGDPSNTADSSSSPTGWQAGRQAGLRMLSCAHADHEHCQWPEHSGQRMHAASYLQFTDLPSQAQRSQIPPLQTLLLRNSIGSPLQTPQDTHRPSHPPHIMLSRHHCHLR